jgi:hypothetical protein
MFPGFPRHFSRLWLPNRGLGRSRFRIEEDAQAGKLDQLFDQADRDFEAGRCTPL